jgi:hypothetical protein
MIPVEKDLVVVGFEHRVLQLLGKKSTMPGRSQVLFAMIIFEIGSYFLHRPACTNILLMPEMTGI